MHSGGLLHGRRALIGKICPVEGESAMWAGLGYIAIAVFFYLFIYVKNEPDSSLLLQLIRVTICVLSLLALACFWYKASPS